MTIATRFVDLPPGHVGRRLLSGRTPWFASQTDPRFVYRLYVPQDLDDEEGSLGLWVFVHGTGRETDLYLDALAAAARDRRAAVLTPLFPVGIGGPDDFYNYQLLEAGGVRYDEVLLAMVDEVGHRWPVDTARFFLHGFSGGGQFANRFVQRHPDRVSAVSIGAPGAVVLPTGAARVPVQVVVGSLDDDPADVSSPGDGPPEGRLAKARRLADAFDAQGWPVRLDVVDGVDHEGGDVLDVVREFLLRR